MSTLTNGWGRLPGSSVCRPVSRPRVGRGLRLRGGAAGEHGSDLVLGQARLPEDLHAVLAEPRLMAPDVAGRAAVRGGNVRRPQRPLARVLDSLPEAGG